MLAVVIFVAAASSFFYAYAGEYLDKRRFPPPGQFVAIDKCRIHLHESGSGSPAVVLEAGIAASSLSWSYVQPLVAKFTRVASYDRPGLGWSEYCKRPRTLEQMSAELFALLAQAGIPPPYVLVGHSFGGLLIRYFAHAKPRDVQGLVLVDPVSIETWAGCSDIDRRRLARGVKLSRRGATLAHLGIVRLALAAASAGKRRLTAVLAGASAGRATSTLGRLVGEVRKLPSEVLPAVRSHWSRPSSFHAMADYLACLPACASSAAVLAVPLEIPAIILSAASATQAELRERDAWLAGRPRSRHIQIENTGHWLHLERPDLVAEAIRELIQ